MHGDYFSGAHEPHAARDCHVGNAAVVCAVVCHGSRVWIRGLHYTGPCLWPFSLAQFSHFISFCVLSGVISGSVCVGCIMHYIVYV